ncbi:hypothetical protein BC833DRAFT_614955 [Globomyces pollinis-pini]|nr:hypothetical protein BC833DRAFT_614955 [Globomyces pollinis-pini]
MNMGFYAFVTILITSSAAEQWSTGRCTYHPYEDDYNKLGPSTYDNSPGWCGIRYSKLNVARITAVHGLGESQCNQCLEMMNANGGPTVYVLAVDQKGDPGLDVAKASFMATFPGANPLDPQNCKWRPVEPSKCGTICYGTKEECTPGKRNLLPGYLLPSMPNAPIGIDVGKSGENTSSNPKTEVTKESTTTTVNQPVLPSKTVTSIRTAIVQSTTQPSITVTYSSIIDVVSNTKTTSEAVNSKHV